MRLTLCVTLSLSLAALIACGPSPQQKAEQAKAEERARLEAALKQMEVRNKPPAFTGQEVKVAGPEGLEYVEELPGTGKEVAAGDTVTVHFIGWCDGTKIDSSFDREKPHSFLVGQGSVIRGWDLGVVGMKEGGKRLLIIPPALAYGHEGRTGFVGPDKTLWYRIEMVKVYKQ